MCQTMCKDKEQQSQKTMEIIYTAGDSILEKYHCPYRIEFKLNKNLKFYVLTPLFTELQRIMNVAFKNQEFDMQFFKNNIQNRGKNFMNEVNK